MDETGRPYEPVEPEYERAMQETPESLAFEEEIIKQFRLVDKNRLQGRVNRMIWKITRRKHNVVFVFGKQAKLLREMLDSAVVPDRTALEKEADEFEQYMLKKREETLARGEKMVV